jgi:hypothetical protein
MRNFRATAGGAISRAILAQRSTGLQTLLRPGNPAPDGNGIVSTPTLVAVGAGGHIVADSTFSGTAGGTTDTKGLMLWDGARWNLLTRAGQLTPSGSFRFTGYDVNARVAPDGRAIFHQRLAPLSGTPGESYDPFTPGRPGNSPPSSRKVT